ncbi:LamG-like jellyroll fold domain-containing protein [Gelidibacter salicanalis]|uniref:T9SS type A sorting domain-containing protein n=1 Tax=Gelidibacter salicanalis TaxID=291193 RepID=A0A934NHU4_9FLAO|nr:LamG-like jellyroll fold domain-containing protein [Gelidibacter salicanalis]MBJ7879314.1 T9SS type A sorting domain-containing protein [Gelidibacter salicanalis]
MKNYYAIFFKAVLFLWVSHVALGNSVFSKNFLIVNEVSETYDLSFDYKGNFDVLNLSGFMGSTALFVERTEVRKVKVDQNDLLERLWTKDYSSGSLHNLWSVGQSYDREWVAVAVCKNIEVYLDANGSAIIAEDAVNNGSSGMGSLTFDTDITSFDCSDVGIPVTVTLTVTDNDNGGSTDSCQASVTVLDKLPPTITCPDNRSIECDASILPTHTGTATAIDNCSSSGNIIIDYTDSVVTGAGNNSVITRTWTATDSHNNTTSCEQIITVTDTTKPVFTTSPTNLTIECSASSLPADTNGPAAATDNCATPTIAYSDAVVNGTGNNKTITRTWTATDANSNIESYVQTITVTDTTKPVFTTSPASLTIECSASSLPADTNGPAAATDNCATPTIAYSDAVVNGTGNNKTITRTWTATDTNSNVASYVQTITVTDTTKPVFTTSPANITIECSASSLPSDTNGPAVATDNCATPTIDYSDTVVNGTGNNKTITRTWTATDANSNVESYVQTITVTDTTKPVFTTSPTNLTIECSASSLPADTNGSAVATDNCATPTIDYSDTVVNGTGNNKTITRTWTATDTNSNIESYVQTITVTDTTKPVFTTSPASLTIECSASSLPADTNGPAVATDNCATPTIAYSDAVVNGTGNNKTITRTWSATDANSNVASYVQTITVTDTKKPVFTTSPASLTIECSASSLPSDTNGPAVATDNCATPTIDYSDTVVNGTGNNKTITRSWTATDANSNVASYVQTITVTDTTKPVFTTSPASLTIECSASSLPADTNGPAAATDNCATPTIAYSDAVVNGTGNNKTITRSWTATDTNSNVASYVQTITVTDTTKPVFTTSPASLTIECSASSLPADTNGPAVATDNCATPTIAYSDAVVNGVGNNKTITRTWTATDANSNVASYVQTITVTDTTKPVFTTSPASLTIECSASSLPADTNGPAAATDNCATPTIAYSDAVVNGTGNNKTITRTWTATDANSNVESYVQTITVTDTTKPVFTTSPASLTIECSASSLPADTNGPAVATDNCATPTIAYSDAVVNGVGNNKTITRTWTATDANSNVASYVQTITVTDTTKPVFTTSPANITIECSASSLPADTNGPAVATDNCATPTIAYSDAVVNGVGNNKTITRTWTATDANSNVASYVQTITVQDTTPPTLTAGSDITVSTSTTTCDISVNVPHAVFSDKCTDTPAISYTLTGATTLTVTDGQVGTRLFNKGVTTIEYTVTDGANLTVKGSKTVTVVDNTAPSLTAGSNITANTSSTTCDASIQVTDAIFSDNCPANISFTLTGATTLAATAGQVGTRTFNKGVTTITYTVTDGVTSVTKSKTVTISDTEKPVTPILQDLNGECSLTVTPPTTIDNCDGTITGTTNLSSLTFNKVGTETIFWEFKDGADNSIIVEQNITITDSAPVPNISILEHQVFNGCQIPDIDYLIRPTADDVCDGTIVGTLGADFIFPFSFSGTETIEWEFVDSHGNITIQPQDITLNPLPINGGTLNGTFKSTVFSNGVDISSCGEAISVAMNLTGRDGTIVQWEKFAVNHGTWEVISNTTTKQTASFAIGALISTYYRVLIQKGTCIAYSNQFFIRALPAGSAPTIINLDDDEFYCLGEKVSLLAMTNYTATQETIPRSSGEFNQGQQHDWIVDDSKNGFTAGGNSGKTSNWSGTNCGKLKDGGIDYCSNEGKFAIANGDYSDHKYKGKIPTTLETPIIDLSNAASASLDFDQAYNFSSGDYAEIEISTDGGLTYSSLRLMHAPGAAPINWFTAGTAESYVGSTASEYNFQTDNTSIDLSAYLNQTQVRIRWSFTGTNEISAWAMDNILVNKEVKVATDIEWTDGIGDPDEDPIIVGETEVEFSFTPDAPGVHQYGGTALISDCRTYDEEGTALIEIAVSHAYAGEDVIYSSETCGQNNIQLNAYDNTKTATENIVKKAFVASANCINCDDKGTGEIGTWGVITDPGNTCGPGVFSTNNPTKYPNPLNDPDAIFAADAGTYTLTWTVAGCTDDIVVTTTSCNQIDFDGTNDFVEFGNDTFNLSNGNFSIEAWVKPHSISGIQTIFSKQNGIGSNSGYDLSIKEGIVSFNMNESGTIDSKSYKIGTDRWYHIAVAYTLSRYSLYIDGVEINSNTGSLPVSNSFKAMLGAMGTSNITKQHFKGWIDEVRIWNVGLVADQLRQMMNQKIISSPTVAGNVQGETIPRDISGLSWSNLTAYFQMDPTKIACGYIKSSSSAIKGKLKNILSNQHQTAPLPYESIANGLWSAKATWKHPTVWDVPNSNGINGSPIDWNIVRTNHTISSDAKDVTLLGLLVDSKELIITGQGTQDENNAGTGLWVTHYLKLNGKIDLVGESQLVQKRYYYNHDNDSNTPDVTYQSSESIFDNASNGYIERDQQGTGNYYNYNYWGSPVVPQGSNAGSFTISSVLRDGTSSSNPREITWINGLDGKPGPPLQISSRWLTTYTNKLSNTYASWDRINENTSINTGLGYTMKGSGADSPTQNYVFIGRPNTGTIITKISKGNDALVGNPYPSAIDADAFIDDNMSSLSEGSLTFWEHFDSNNTHVLRAYKGGYATYNKTGGQVAVSPNVTSDNITIIGGKGTRIPGRYLPVGQGFFITAGTREGEIIFKNSQRIFKREEANSSVFFKGVKGSSVDNQQRTTNTKENDIKRIRLDFISPENTVRPLLLGFVPNDLATDGVDYGYDALNKDNYPSDLSWMINKSKYIIQGVGNFDETKRYPFALHLGKNGAAEIKLTELENFTETIDVYIYDSVLGTYHQINSTNFTISLDAGNYDNRFYLAFSEEKSLSIIDEEFKNVVVKYLQNTDEIYIKTPNDIEVQQVSLVNIIGQTVQAWNATNTTLSNDMKIPVKYLPDGNYIVKIQTTTGTFNKKVIVKY